MNKCYTPLRRAVVTHNRVDFEKQHAKFLESGMTHYGMIIAKRRKDAEVVNKMLSLLDAVNTEEMKINCAISNACPL